MTQQELEGLKVFELVALLPKDVIEEHSIKSNTKRSVVMQLVADHYGIDLKESNKFDKKKADEEMKAAEEENKLKEFAKTARKAFERKPGKRVYVARNHNYLLKSKGIDKDGKLIRYAVGFDTLDIKEQNKNNPEGVKVELIKFEGLNPDAQFNIEGFGTARSMLTVPKHNQMLQKYIESHKSFGHFFIEWDKTKQNKIDVMEREEKGKLEGIIANAGKDELLVPLVYTDFKSGIDSFDRLIKLDIYELKKKAYDQIDYDYKEFLENVNNSYARALHLVNKSKKGGIITVSKDGRNVRWVSNNENIVTVPIGQLWQEKLIDYMLAAENIMVVRRLQELTGFNVLD